MRAASLIVFAGLPASGKTTLARMISEHYGAVFLRIDTLEQALRELCDMEVEGEGYRLAYRLAADNLRLGNTVVADSCNPIELTRQEWRNVAVAEGSACIEIEVVCSDSAEHRRRAEARKADVGGLVLPTWEQIQARNYDSWKTDRIVVDTAASTPQESFQVLLRNVARYLT